jgi:hypothetical protein
MPRCGGNQFEIVINKLHPTTCEPLPWAVGNVFAGEMDLRGILAHEFGHALNLGHPANGEGAVMAAGHDGGSTRYRDLYQWDLKCAAQIAGHRNLTGYRRHHWNGTLENEVAFTGTWNVSKVAAGVTHFDQQLWWSAAIKRNDCLAWTRSLNTLDTNCTLADNRMGIGPTARLWLEDMSTDRVLYASYGEAPEYDLNARHFGMVHWSSNEFLNEGLWWLSHCGSMTDWMTCGATQPPVYTGKAMGVGWDAGNSRTVFAWAHQNRLSDSADGEVRVAIGYINDAVLPQPTLMGVRTTAPPAVACGPTSTAAGGHRCILAYVNKNNPWNEISIIRFTPSQGAMRYELSTAPAHLACEAPLVVPCSTGSRIAAWYHDGKFWLAYRPTRLEEQPLQVINSTNGFVNGGYNYVGSFGYSAIGPSVGADWTANNQLVYAR